MKTQKKDVLYDVISRKNPVTLRVEPGEVFQIETRLNSGTWLQSVEDDWHPSKMVKVNASSGSVYVEGAKPGDMLKIKIIDIVPEGLGQTGWDQNIYPLRHWVEGGDWDVVTKTVRIEDGFIHWSDEVKIPIHPMIGGIGTAPAVGTPRIVDAGTYGGNLDIQEVSAGNTIYLPVFVEGGLLHVGDVHAVQGDCEIGFNGGIECGSLCTLQIDVLPKPESMTYPRLEGDDWIGAVGLGLPMEVACHTAIRELAKWMMDDYGFTQPDAVLLLGSVMEARATQIVNSTFTYVAKIKKKYLKAVNDAKYF